MRHIDTYDSYLNEKMGMPAGLYENASEMALAASETLSVMMSRSMNDKTMWFTTIKPFPFGEITCKISLRQIKSQNLYVNGGVPARTMEVAYLNDVPTYKVDMELEVFGGYDELEQLERDLAKDKFAAAKLMEKSVTHELLHIYESFLRVSKKAPNLNQMYTIIYDTVGGYVRRNFGPVMPQAMHEFFYLVYLAQAPEVSARVAEAYSVLSGIKDYRERERVLKSSSVWDAAELMTNYDAREYMRTAREQFEQEIGKHYEVRDTDWERLLLKIIENMDDLLKMVDSKIHDYLVLSKRDSADDRKKAEDMYSSAHMKKGLKSATTDMGKFMKLWQGIINRAGEKLKRKLTKVITATDD